MKIYIIIICYEIIFNLITFKTKWSILGLFFTYFYHFTTFCVVLFKLYIYSLKVYLFIFFQLRYSFWGGFPDSSIGKESACNAGDPGLIPESGRSAGEEIDYPLQCSWASLVAQLVKNLPVMQNTGFDPWVGQIPWRRERLPTSVLWPKELHGLYKALGLQRVGYDWLTFLSLFRVSLCYVSF